MADPRQELESALSPLAWILNFIWDTFRLMFWFFMSPILIITWCFHHPVEARLYAVSAIPLLWNSNWGTRGLLVFFVVLIGSLFGKTMHRICWGIVKLALVAGLIWYIYMIFKLAEFSHLLDHVLFEQLMDLPELLSNFKLFVPGDAVFLAESPESAVGKLRPVPCVYE